MQWYASAKRYSVAISNLRSLERALAVHDCIQLYRQTHFKTASKLKYHQPELGLEKNIELIEELRTLSLSNLHFFLRGWCLQYRSQRQGASRQQQAQYLPSAAAYPNQYVTPPIQNHVAGGSQPVPFETHHVEPSTWRAGNPPEWQQAAGHFQSALPAPATQEHQQQQHWFTQEHYHHYLQQEPDNFNLPYGDVQRQGFDAAEPASIPAIGSPCPQALAPPPYQHTEAPNIHSDWAVQGQVAGPCEEPTMTPAVHYEGYQDAMPPTDIPVQSHQQSVMPEGNLIEEIDAGAEGRFGKNEIV